ncbi:SPASM domain-containing protein [Haliscomenobacter sp.]|uniref:SPASM domain-containing protein n=1 Tax=Haliscomenobacter sp. TaxID=2717303 RepID=UPI003BA85AB4
MLRVTPRKIWNATKVLSSYYLSRLLQKPIQWGVPFSISIEPTTACNLRCPECPSGLRAFSRPTGNLRSDFFRKTIDDLHRDLSFLIFYFQGEPYINPDFLGMVQYASQRGIYTITSTNGHFLNEENARKTIESGLDRLIISVDGSTQEVYEQYRKSGKLEVVLQGARNVVKWKKELKSKTPHLIFQFLVVRPNEHQIPEIYKLAEEIGIDEVRLKTAQIYDYAQGSPLIPNQDRYSRYRKQADGSYRIKNQLLNHCWKLWHACVITWDGVVVPCCFDKDAQYRMGNLQEQSLREVWQQQPYREFRQQLLKGRDKIDICTNCTEGCKIWA